jgi:heme-degrading monooxygenase HmoA
MSYVVINAMTVPDGNGTELERRFAARAGAVDQAPGFEHFELLRPASGTETYLVYTRWATKADFEAWQASAAFSHGHRGPAGAGEQAPPPAASGSEIWSYEVVTESSPAS